MPEHGLLGFNQFDLRGFPTSLLVQPAVAWNPSNPTTTKAQYLEASIRNEQGPSSPTGRGCTSAKYALAAGKLTERSSRENLGEAPEVGELEPTQFLIQIFPSLPRLDFRAPPNRASPVLILTLAAQRTNRTLPTPQRFVFRESLSEPRNCALKTFRNAHFAACCYVKPAQGG